MEFDELAIKSSSWTWSTLRNARKLDFQIGEESITDLLILNMKKWGKGTVDIKTFTRPQEGKNGSDWQMWFTGPSGKWLGMRVQAKVLNFASENFEHLHYKNSDNPRFQVELLIDDAERHGLIPLYCLYSNWNTSKYKTSWRCHTHRNSVYHFGTSILSPYIVDQLRKDGKENRLASIIKHIRPMHCIFCCNCFGEGDLPERALRYIKDTGFLDYLAAPAGNIPDSGFVRNTAPDYLYLLLNRELGVDFSNFVDDRIGRIIVVRERVYKQDSKLISGEEHYGF